jgi:hypothetical protein
MLDLITDFFAEPRVSFFFSSPFLGFERCFVLRTTSPERFFFFSARWCRAGMDWFNSFLAMARKDS